MLVFLVVGIFVFTTIGVGSSVSSQKVPNRVPKVNSVVKVDAVLDEPLWQEALVMELNFEVGPGENIPPPVRTEVLLAYDDTQLFAAFRAYDPDPSQIRARVCDRDNLWSDDWVALNLDTFNDERQSFLFICNPLGVQADDIEVLEGGSGGDWDAIWDSDGRITNQGFIVEMVIPFSSLRFQRTEGDQIWGFDAIRSYPRNIRHHIGLFPRDRSNNCYLCQAEKLIGFAGVIPGKNIEFDPTISGFFSQEREYETTGSFLERDKEFNAGVTARWGFTPNLMLSGTANPDFSQVEADAAQLDINKQFAIFYGEKRPFFLEGSNLFHTRLRVVHTRTVADPEWGIKLTGQEGPHAIGFFSARDHVTNMLFPSSEGSDDVSLDSLTTSTVLRYRMDIASSTNVGVLFTDREGKDYYNRLGGFDGNLRFTQRDRVQFQFLGSRTKYPYAIAEEFDQPTDTFDGIAFDVIYNHSTRGLDWYGVYRQAEPKFRADMGFMPQVNFRFSEGGWGYTWHRDPGSWWHMLNVGNAVDHEEDFDGTLIQEQVKFWFNYEGPIQTRYNLEGGIGSMMYEGEEFESIWMWTDGSITPSKSLSFWIGSEISKTIDYDNTREGHVFSIIPEVEYKLGRHLTTSYNHTYEQMRVEGGLLYTANVGELRFVYQFTKRAFLRTITQYVNYRRDIYLYEDDDVDAEEQSLFNQVLFSYKINPQTVLFLGYTDDYFSDREIRITQTNRTIFAKIGYAWVL